MSSLHFQLLFQQIIKVDDNLAIGRVGVIEEALELECLQHWVMNELFFCLRNNSFFWCQHWDFSIWSLSILCSISLVVSTEIRIDLLSELVSSYLQILHLVHSNSIEIVIFVKQEWNIEIGTL